MRKPSYLLQHGGVAHTTNLPMCAQITRSTSKAHFYKHRGGELQFSCMAGVSVPGAAAWALSRSWTLENLQRHVSKSDPSSEWMLGLSLTRMHHPWMYRSKS